MDSLDHTFKNNEPKHWSGERLCDEQNTAGDSGKAGAKNGGGGACAPRRGLRVSLRGARREGSWTIGSGEVAEGKVGVRTSPQRSGSKGTPEDVLVVGKRVSRRGSPTCLERTITNHVRLETFLDRQRE